MGAVIPGNFYGLFRKGVLIINSLLSSVSGKYIWYLYIFKEVLRFSITIHGFAMRMIILQVPKVSIKRRNSVRPISEVHKFDPGV